MHAAVALENCGLWCIRVNALLLFCRIPELLSSGVVFLIQELKTALSAKEAEKVEVQKELHELQIRVRDISGPIGLGLHDIDHDAVQNIIEDMEAHRIGA